MFAVPKNVRELSRGDIGQSFINLKWTKPLGLYSSFRIVYVATGQSSVTVNVGDVQQEEINRLIAGTRYTLTVFTLRGNDVSSGSPIDITTGEVCVRACVRACVRGCVRACVHACMRVCVS